MIAAVSFLDDRRVACVAARAPVRLSGSRTALAATLTCFNRSEAFIETHERPALQSVISVRPADESAAAVSVRVVRVDQRGVAVQWLESGEHLDQLLDALHARQLAPALVA